MIGSRLRPGFSLKECEEVPLSQCLAGLMRRLPMRHLTSAVVLLALAVARAEAGGPDYWINSAVVDQVQADATKIVFTVSGPCTIYIQAPDREDKANRVDTALKRCVITITKEAFEKSAERSLMTWSDCQTSAKALAGKNAIMQFS